ncbi:MAG TPA: hypothetical protein VEJ63_14045 [Planctomycetota bacterium]|nr:hypothetical protein [Planctomycetota bacterium]
MKKKSIARVIVGVLAVVLVASWLTPSFAQQKFLEKIRKHYNLDRTNGKCTLCHEERPKEEPGRKNLNSFGKAIQNHADMKPLLGKTDEYAFTAKELETFDAIVMKIENEDSDGDKVTNREELDLGTYPGDAKSVPEKAKLEKYRKDAAAKKDSKDAKDAKK